MKDLSILKEGFNTKVLAEMLHCSNCRVNGLAHEPIEGEVYHKANINVKAIERYCENNKIELTDEQLKKAVESKGTAIRKNTLVVGTVLKNGFKIVKILDLAGTLVYDVLDPKTGKSNLCSKKMIKEYNK